MCAIVSCRDEWILNMRREGRSLGVASQAGFPCTSWCRSLTPTHFLSHPRPTLIALLASS